MEEAQFALISLQARVSMQREMAASVGGKAFSPLVGGGKEAPTDLWGTHSAVESDQQMAGALNSAADQAGVKLALLQAQLDDAVAKLGKAGSDELDKAAKAAERLKKKLDEDLKSAMAVADSWNNGWSKQSLAAPISSLTRSVRRRCAAKCDAA